MKQNKGFTLIELLAVIVILAIIALIATPMILGVIETAKKGAVKSSALGYIDAVEKQVAINELDSTKTKLNDGVYEISKLKDTQYGITVKGDVPDSGTVTIKGGQVVSYSLVIDDYTVTYDSNSENDDVIVEKSDEVSGETGSGDSSDGTGNGNKYPDNLSTICIPAQTLHTKDTTTYGKIPSGTVSGLQTGDAFDCDVDGTGYNHRFYYVSDYYDTKTKTFDNTRATLVYYSNIDSDGNPDNNRDNYVSYNTTTESFYGPTNAMQNLPTKSKWGNLEVIGVRTLVNSNGESLATSDIDYSSKVARFLTHQEVVAGCSENLDFYEVCRFLVEDENVTSDSSYWLETRGVQSHNTAFNIYTGYVSIGDSEISYTKGVRPAIELYKNQLGLEL